MMKAVATAVDTAERIAGQAPVQPLYLEALTLVERLHRLLQSEEAGRARLPRSSAFARRSPLGPHSADRAGPGNPPHRRCALSEARQDGGAGRRHLERGIRDPEQVAAPARAVLDRPDPVPSLRAFDPGDNGEAG